MNENWIRRIFEAALEWQAAKPEREFLLMVSSYPDCPEALVRMQELGSIIQFDGAAVGVFAQLTRYLSAGKDGGQ